MATILIEPFAFAGLPVIMCSEPLNRYLCTSDKRAPKRTRHSWILERTVKQVLSRIGLADRVHIGAGSWIIVGDDRPRLSRGAEREVAKAIDMALRVPKFQESNEILL